MANLSNINNKFLFTDGDFLKIGNLAPINNISGTESGISVTNGNCASITLDNSAAQGKTFSIYSAVNGSLNFFDVDAASGRLVIDTSGNSTFAGDVIQSSVSKSLKYWRRLWTDANNDWGLNNNAGSAVISVSGMGTPSSSLTTFAGNVIAPELRLQASGTTYLNIGNATTGSASTDGASIGYFSGQSSLQIIQRENDAMVFSTNSNERMRVSADGKVTIGNTAAVQPLTVAGNVLFRTTTVDGFENRFQFIPGGSGDPGNFYVYNDTESPKVRLNAGGDSYLVGGDVGIGETSPSQKLNVRDDGGSDVFRGIEVHNNNQSLARAGISFQCYDWVQSAIWHGRSSTAAYGGALVLGTNPNTSDLTVSGVTGRMWILNSGNVGIGTNTPTKQLHLLRTTGDVRGIMVETSVTTSYAEVQVKAASEFRIGTGGSSTVPNGQFYIYDATAGAHRFDIDANGNVGIGTTSPTAKLDINGTVRYQGNTYNQLTYQVSGNYSANTWYTIATNATLTEQGIYILVAYVEDFTAGGSNYYIHAASTNFYWDTTSTNRTTAFNFPALLGTGHATGSLPLIRITQELGTAGAQSKIQWQTPYTYTGLNPGLGGKKLIFYFKRIGG